MNTAMPPFDDIHIRKAMNWAVNKANQERLVGGTLLGTVATHDVPNTMLPVLQSYDPYQTPGDQGDINKAKQEVMQSKYDANHDGVCDASECKNVLMVIDQIAPLGITLNIKQFQTTTMYTKCEDATQKVPICPSEGWYADFADPFAFVTGLFSSGALTPSCCDDSVMAATSADLQKWGYPGTTPTPNIDEMLNRCIPMQGTARESCYADIDKDLMENVVPWVPYRFANQVVITSTRTVNYHLDASTGWISLSQIALKNGGA
jgi:ABC-type transport system substrate-binding protein